LIDDSKHGPIRRSGGGPKKNCPMLKPDAQNIGDRVMPTCAPSIEKPVARKDKNLRNDLPRGRRKMNQVGSLASPYLAIPVHVTDLTIATHRRVTS
jgi:hypothetical protein